MLKFSVYLNRRVFVMKTGMESILPLRVKYFSEGWRWGRAVGLQESIQKVIKVVSRVKNGGKSMESIQEGMHGF